MACEGTELVGLSPTANTHTSNGAALGNDQRHQNGVAVEEECN